MTSNVAPRDSPVNYLVVWLLRPSVLMTRINLSRVGVDLALRRCLGSLI
jgi:hypothetical protein